LQPTGEVSDISKTKATARTVDLSSQQCRSHILPALGARKLRDLTTADVDRWLAKKAKSLSTRTCGFCTRA
jgi:Phage integrase, N-terminal SAM-like domain